MTLTQNKYRISPVIAKRAILLLGFGIVPFALIHETGHIVGCVAGGYDFELNLSVLSFTVYCSGIPSNTWFYWGFGGGLASIVSATLAIVFKTHRSIVISMTTVAVGQLVTAGVETFAHSFYVDNFYYPPISYLFTFIPLLIKLGRNTYGMETRDVTITAPKPLKSFKLIIALISVIAVLVISVDTLSTAYYLSHSHIGIRAETNDFARLLISNTGFALIVGIKTLGVGAIIFVALLVAKVKRYLPLVNVGLIVILAIYSYVASNNLYLVLKLLLK